MAEKINPQHHGALVSMFEKIEIEGMFTATRVSR